MSRTILITGAASGIGAATAARLRSKGHRVIGADLRDTDILADLATVAGRASLVEQAKRLAPDGLDGVIAGAGFAEMDNPEQMIRVNHFGAVATLEGLRPLLARSKAPRAVAISSLAAILPGKAEVIAACLARDEDEAVRLALAAEVDIYESSKTAMSLWLRHAAISADWAGAGILLNGVAPGAVYTPMTEPLLATEEGRAFLAERTPIALQAYGQPEDLAEVLDFLVNLQGGYMLGQIVFVDGGTETLRRTETI